MPLAVPSTQRDQALALLRRRGLTRLAELRSAGVTGTTVSRMERAGEVVRLARVPTPRSTHNSRWPKHHASYPRA